MNATKACPTIIFAVADVRFLCFLQHQMTNVFGSVGVVCLRRAISMRQLFLICTDHLSTSNKFSRLLGDLLSDAIESHYSDKSRQDFPDVVLPVPVHRQRLLERGFNQAEQIARTVTDRFGLRADTTSIARSVLKLPQSSLSAAQREANIRRAFEVRQPDNIRGKHVAIVDDVYTTGATARSVSRRLKSAGARRISMWAVARTP